jgi:hypothetical protein
VVRNKGGDFEGFVDTEDGEPGFSCRERDMLKLAERAWPSASE